MRTPDMQALANIVFAYNKANLLDRELLQWIFNLAAFRLEYLDSTGSSHLGFKPQVRQDDGLHCSPRTPEHCCYGLVS